MADQAPKVFRTELHPHDIWKPIRLPDSNLRNIIEVTREIVPIIFIPGIMGSRLRDRTGKKVWDPDAQIFMLAKFGLLWQNAGKRKDQLVGHSFDPEHLSVIEDDVSHNQKFCSKSDRTRAERGWGGIAWGSYGTFLLAMQNKQWEPLVNLVFNMPVHAFGYNWTGSNSTGGKRLAAYIDSTIGHYREKKYLCESVILVTHSMGGLVARAACKLHGSEDKVLGVVHGVQPAMGSPAAYWRMKGGFERPHTIPQLDSWQWWRNTSKMAHHEWKTFVTKGPDLFTGMNVGLGNVTTWVLGTDGEEVTSLLGNMPGGLELLPNKEYRDNDGSKEWLVFINPEGQMTRLPKADPYQEIYRRKEEFYRLVNPKWLDPGAKFDDTDNNAAAEKDTDDSLMKGPWQSYLANLKKAERFHDALSDAMHHDTYQFYSTGVASADRVVYVRSWDTWGEKGNRVLEMVQNEWFGGAPPETRKKGSLSWRDIIFIPVKAASLANPVKLVGLLLKDTEWYINRGGYRDKVDKELKPDDGREEGESPVEVQEVQYVITMKNPDGAGDGTVPESSACALDPSSHASVKGDGKREIIRRTFAIGDGAGAESAFVARNAPRTKPKMPVDFDEAWFYRGHEPIYQSKSAQHITFTAIENLCRRRIAQFKKERRT